MDPAHPPTDSAAIRRRNLGLVLRHLADHGPVARTEVAAATGLAHGSVTALVADLTDRGLLREDDALRSGTRGRPGRPLRLIPSRALVAAVQVTSEHLRVAVADLAGEMLWRDTVAHALAPGTPRAMADAIAGVITRIIAALPEIGIRADTSAAESGADARSAGDHDTLAARSVLARVVIAMAGPVGDDAAHTVLVAPDFGWMEPVRLGELVARRLVGAAPAIDVVNDANAAALAEFHALNHDSRGLVLIEAGTGIGGGVVLDGRIHTGSHGVAGEPGHIPVTIDGPECVCGARGCLVLYTGPEAVFEAAGLQDRLHRSGSQAANAELLTLLRRGDVRALDALDRAARALSVAILAVTALLDADEVVLGGLLADWFPWLAPTVEARLAGRRALAGGLGLGVTPAALGADGILVGALGFARRAVLSDPSVVPPLPVGAGTRR
ncbi:ROK family transcriptional regulator [Nocardia yunnanensis]|uniref:ROK family transcriptional regulator n=1 Tax=Nocardia yunnanensis TaxID=2382165 RepID=A0A386ZCN1_9NOCA|nr:ROK family transcriptional regulator [Nocardia yunnanensis]AYF74259.1 ROK family transcriptional regulator [Nocardia yunnanensis]